MLLVAEPYLDFAEQEAVLSVLQSGWITTGARVQAFEAAFAERHDAAGAVAVDSCTAALHLALASLGIGPGDEVLVPSMTFVATVNAILYVGAEPVLVDIEGLDAPLMSIAEAETKVTPRTRAVMLMHFAGHLAERVPWQEFARRHGLLLVEDSAHAVGVPGVGSYGDAAAFSFYGNKNMTTGEGGMVLMRDEAMLEKVRLMRGHGMTRTPMQRLATRNAHYDVEVLGFNYRMDEMRAAIGLVQLGRLEGFNQRRASLVDRYCTRLKAGSLKDLIVIPRPRSGVSAHHIMPVVLPEGVDRSRVATEMHGAGVQTTIHYPAVHTLSYHRRQQPHLHLPVTEEFARRELTLPLHPGMTEADVDRVVDALETSLQDALQAS